MESIDETQKMNQKWIWILLIVIEVFLLYYIIANDSENWLVKIIPFIIVFLVGLFIYIIKLKWRMTKDEISISFFPFLMNTKTIKIKDIHKIAIVKYNPLKEFGGWGLRYSSNKTAYTTRGNLGIELEMKNGKTLLIGTQKDSYELFNDLLELHCENEQIIISNN